MKFYLLSLLIFSIIDGIWLATMSKSFYMQKLAHLSASNPNLLFAALFYILYPLAIAVLVLNGTEDVKTILIKAAILGVTAYGTYNLTNAAILKDWPTIVVVVDIIWGAFVTASTSYIVYLVSQKI